MRKALIFAIVLFVSLISCEKPTKYTKISKNGEKKSHGSEKNCMSCHYSEGEGEGWFYIGGTIKGNFHNGKVLLFPDGFDNPASDSVEIDDYGNIFTTEFVDFSKGMNIAVINSNGDSLKMPSEVTVGQCNMCHGKTQIDINMY